jgi:hypothetical protein
MRYAQRTTILAVLAALASHPALAQRLPPPWPTLEYGGLAQGRQPSPLSGRHHSVVLPAAGALVFGTAGFLGGALVGYRIGRAASDSSCDLFCGWSAMLVGAILGESLGVGAGAHLGDGHRGNLAADLGVSLLGGAVGTVLLSLTSGCTNCTGNTIIAVSVPIVQIGAAIAMDRATARSEP